MLELCNSVYLLLHAPLLGLANGACSVINDQTRNDIFNLAVLSKRPTAEWQRVHFIIYGTLFPLRVKQHITPHSSTRLNYTAVHLREEWKTSRVQPRNATLPFLFLFFYTFRKWSGSICFFSPLKLLQAHFSKSLCQEITFYARNIKAIMISGFITHTYTYILYAFPINHYTHISI